MKKHQYTIIGQLVDKSGSLRDRAAQFNQMHHNEIEERQLVTVMPYSHTVEITVKKFDDYDIAKQEARLLLRYFMQNREYTTL